MSVEAEAQELLLLLKEFAPVLSIAVGVNLVSSFWDAMRNKAVNRFDTQMELLHGELSHIFDTKCENLNTYQSIANKASGFKDNLIKLSRVSTIVGICVVVTLLGALALMGYDPHFKISSSIAHVLMFISFAPTATFMIIGYGYSSYAVRTLKGKCEDAKDTARDLARHQLMAYGS
ncbi:hypothetical protein [Vibrio vulnificus]|uniref:hypothetical protein n=1 Tax=Vibrio vulnificus TaxID=672 RepID=UPI0032EAAE7B